MKVGKDEYGSTDAGKNCKGKRNGTDHCDEGASVVDRQMLEGMRRMPLCYIFRDLNVKRLIRCICMSVSCQQERVKAVRGQALQVCNGAFSVSAEFINKAERNGEYG